MKAEMVANTRVREHSTSSYFGLGLTPCAAVEGVEHTPLNLMLYENKLKEIIRVQENSKLIRGK